MLVLSQKIKDPPPHKLAPHATHTKQAGAASVNAGTHELAVDINDAEGKSFWLREATRRFLPYEGL